MQIVWKAFIFKRDTSSFKLISPDTKTVEIRKQAFCNKSFNLAIQQSKCQKFQCQMFQSSNPTEEMSDTWFSHQYKSHCLEGTWDAFKSLATKFTNHWLHFSSNVSSKSLGEKKKNYTSAVFRDYTTGPNTLWLGSQGESISKQKRHILFIFPLLRWVGGGRKC